MKLAIHQIILISLLEQWSKCISLVLFDFYRCYGNKMATKIG